MLVSNELAQKTFSAERHCKTPQLFFKISPLRTHYFLQNITPFKIDPMQKRPIIWTVKTGSSILHPNTKDSFSPHVNLKTFWAKCNKSMFYILVMILPLINSLIKIVYDHCLTLFIISAFPDTLYVGSLIIKFTIFCVLMLK